MVAHKQQRIPNRTIARLSLYRRLLNRLLGENTQSVYSHELAAMAGVTAAQVRRDLMVVGYQGSPTRGYDVRELLASIGRLLDAPEREGIALVGVGNLGRAIMAYFSGRRPKLSIVAGFDNDPGKVGRMIHGCPCYDVREIADVVRRLKIRSAIIAVPASEAQSVAETLIHTGVRGLLNFAPVRLRVQPEVYVEDMDIAVSLEKVAYFSRQSATVRERQPEARVTVVAHTAKRAAVGQEEPPSTSHAASKA